MIEVLRCLRKVRDKKKLGLSTLPQVIKEYMENRSQNVRHTYNYTINNQIICF